MSKRSATKNPENSARERIANILRNLYACIDCPLTRSEDLSCELIDIKRVIRTLPPDWRAVVSLLGLQGLTEDEAAARLGISQKTANRRLWRAAAWIEERLQLLHSAAPGAAFRAHERRPFP